MPTARRVVRLLAPIVSGLGVAAALGAFAACGARSELEGGGGSPVAIVDASADAVADAPMEARFDAPVDAPPDAPVDAPPDAPLDAPVDAPMDARFDAPVDAPPDAPVDAPPDAPLDAPVDAPVDAPADAGPSCGSGGLTAYLWDQTGFLYTFDPATLGVAPVGQVTCPTSAEPWTLSVSRTGVAYMLYADWNIYRVDLTTLDCTTTPYVPGQLGLTPDLAIAVSRGQGVERLFVYGYSGNDTMLAVSDLTTFVLSPVGTLSPPPTEAPVDMQGDAFGRLYVLGNDDTFFELDSVTAQVSSVASVNIPEGDWAVMVYGTDVYFFTGDGTVNHYDPPSNQLTLLANLGIPIVGASAAPCMP